VKEVLALEDFKAWMKNMEKQGEADFFIGWNIKACYYEENKRKRRNQGREEGKKRQRNNMQKTERNDNEGRKIEVYDERMLSLWM